MTKNIQDSLKAYYELEEQSKELAKSVDFKTNHLKKLEKDIKDAEEERVRAEKELQGIRSDVSHAKGVMTKHAKNLQELEEKVAEAKEDLGNAHELVSKAIAEEEASIAERIANGEAVLDELVKEIKVLEKKRTDLESYFAKVYTAVNA